LDATNPNNTPTPTNGSAITTWVDKSSNSTNVTISGSPTYKTGTNSPFVGSANTGTPSANKASIYLSGSQYFTFSLSSAASQYTLFIVESRSIQNVSASQSLFSSGAINSGYNLDYSYFSYSPASTSYFYTSYVINGLLLRHESPTENSSSNPNTVFVFPRQIDSAGPTIIVATMSNVSGNSFKKLDVYYPDGSRLHQEHAVTYSSTTNLSGTIYLGALSGGSAYYNGYIGEVILYNTILTNQQHYDIVNYLNRRWFLGSCP
jgi:hypothetical protein